MKQKKYKSLQELFRSKDRWHSGSDAADSEGITVPVRSKDAVRWCLRGGAELIYGRETPEFYKAMHRMDCRLPAGYFLVTEFNDAITTTITDIRRVVKKAGV